MTDLDPTAFFAALADPTRLALVQLLASLPKGHQQCVRALAWRLGVSQPAVSQHLRVLSRIGLVHGERSGPRVHYSLDRERLLQGQALLQAIHDTPRVPPERPPEAACRARRASGGRGRQRRTDPSVAPVPTEADESQSP